jgi:uncharacterized protein YsxB (DUF464 family)
MLVCAAISLTGSSTALGFREEGRWVVVEEQNDAVLWAYLKNNNNFNKAILVILHPKMTLFWFYINFNGFI